MRKLVWLILIAVIAGGGWFAWAVWMPVDVSGQTFVMLHPGYSTRRIAAELKAAGLIRSADAFVLLHYIHDRRSLKAGEYLFDKPASTLDIQKRLQRGDVYFHTVVVPEGYTMFDIARAVEAAGLGPADNFLKEARSDTALIADIAPNAHSLEGYLFPDTYEFSRMQSMEEIAEAMVKQFRGVARQIGLTGSATPGSATPGPAMSGPTMSGPTMSGPTTTGPDLVASRELHSNSVADAALAHTPNDLERTVIMASIVEKETSVPEERPLVASVYYNRLAKRIALDADPSIIYAELLAGTYQGALHHADMSVSSPYNTYHNPGLPPGPIANPGKSALEAAMHPAQSDYYYFVADAEGHHRFARTIEEHDKNVEEYRKAMRGR
jgi:UPF0755 protein